MTKTVTANTDTCYSSLLTYYELQEALFLQTETKEKKEKKSEYLSSIVLRDDPFEPRGQRVVADFSSGLTSTSRSWS
ncbi:hypothetical protein TNCV_1899931 [Trichonephila clavipes]|nr:hypothetical protein TNCV_1899931 [Trichonephila clavipes]